MPRLLTPPEIDWREDGTPVARAHNDVYFTAGDGLAESRAVFLAGCGLPDAWQGREVFTVAEPIAPRRRPGSTSSVSKPSRSCHRMPCARSTAGRNWKNSPR